MQRSTSAMRVWVRVRVQSLEICRADFAVRIVLFCRDAARRGAARSQFQLISRTHARLTRLHSSRNWHPSRPVHLPLCGDHELNLKPALCTVFTLRCSIIKMFAGKVKYEYVVWMRWKKRVCCFCNAYDSFDATGHSGALGDWEAPALFSSSNSLSPSCAIDWRNGLTCEKNCIVFSVPDSRPSCGPPLLLFSVCCSSFALCMRHEYEYWVDFSARLVSADLNSEILIALPLPLRGFISSTTCANLNQLVSYSTVSTHTHCTSFLLRVHMTFVRCADDIQSAVRSAFFDLTFSKALRSITSSVRVQIHSSKQYRYTLHNTTLYSHECFFQRNARRNSILYE